MGMRNIGFTGHRDKMATSRQLGKILDDYGKDSIWHWGAAKNGFDTQIERLAKANKIHAVPYYPRYDLYASKVAPIMRNYLIVDASEIIVALWDGRKSGGTYRTVEYAIEQGKKVVIFTPE
jgi:hypothetical protein